MATVEEMSLAQARRVICGELTRFTKFRRAGLTSGRAAAELGTGPEAGDLYEATLRQLLALATNTIDPAPGLEAIQGRTQRSETAPAATDAAPTPEGNH